MRRPITIGLTAAALLVVILPNCTSDYADTDAACQEYVEAINEFTQRCQPNTAGFNFYTIAGDRFIAVCHDNIKAPGSENAGAAVRSCTTQLQTATCDESYKGCSKSTRGTLLDGSGCQEDLQCASGICDGINNECGHCVAGIAVGQPCMAKTTKCVFGAVCANDTCQMEVISHAGQACDSLSIKCEKGLRCETTNGAHVCVAPGALGATCASSAGCKSELRCVDGSCVQGLLPGEACDPKVGCGTPFCGPDRRCVQFVYVDVGQPCDYGRYCIRGRCKGIAIDPKTNVVTPGICEAALPDGAACQVGVLDAPVCDLFAECLAGTCQLPNPARCH